MKYRGQYAASGQALGVTVGEFLEAGDEIMLTCCFGGFGGRISPAQLLANQTGRTVRASFGVYQKISGVSGLNRTLTPLTGVAKTLSNAGGLAFSGLARGGKAISVLYRLRLLRYLRQFWPREGKIKTL
jgi:hypothetical protein